MKVEKIDREAIIDELIKKGYVAKSISYKELQALYKKYGRGMSEADFARLILDVSYSVYNGCKNGYNQVIVLKSYKTYVTQEDIERIVDVLKVRGYVRKKIFYTEFCELYDEYGKGMTEIEFAQRVLDIAPRNFDSCKYSGTRADILKSVKVSAKEIRTRIEMLVQEGYKGKKISYEKLNELFLKYGKGMRERDFAQNVLGVLYNSYCSCKSGKSRVGILSDEFLENVERIPKIIEKLKAEGYIGKSISYTELKELYEEHGKGMVEREFALRVLEISFTYYTKCKNGEFVIILKSYQEELVKKEIELMVAKLKEDGYVGKTITYEELQRLYQECDIDISESDFAQKVLGIGHRIYCSCKFRCGKVKVLLKYKKRITQDEVAAIIEIIRERGYIGKSISYDEMQSLYQQYGKEMTEEEFAIRVLGITYANYMSGKSKDINLVVKDGIAVEKASEILNLYINVPGFYSQQLIDKICEVYDISLEDFVTYVYFGGFGNVDYVLEAIKRNGGLCIGKLSLSEQFANEHVDLIQKAAYTVAKDLCRKYWQTQKISDYTQDAIVYILENMGREEQNVGDSIELFEKLMYYKIRCFLKGRIIGSFRISKRTCSLYRKRNKDNEILDLPYEDKRANLENMVIDSCTETDLGVESEKCIMLLKQYIENGYTREEAIAYAAQEMNIDANQMLEYMQHYLIAKGKVKISTTGKVQWEYR